MYSHYLKFEKVLAKIELFFVVIPFILILSPLLSRFSSGTSICPSRIPVN